ncbi:helix-turn-helix domain-containing protein [Thermogemmatispora onikobensis]|uniref:helix-turn-helix domain-containing protein n=1 Tax=Thermogemmatispora onikobensis TaxID=732234 RepID=UPI000A034795|nr:helix-turn-helix transcriptional regulator [Thermogemmatispora onikobensis]
MSPKTPNHLGSSVGARVRAIRQARKLTQSQLAGQDFSISYISAIERGQIQPSIRALEILASRLNVSPAQLLAETGGGPLGQPAAVARDGRHALASESELHLRLLESEIWIHEGELARATAALQDLISAILPRQDKARVYYLLALATFSSGHLSEAERSLEECRQLLADYEPSSLKARILYLSGLVHFSMQNYYLAEFFYNESISIADRITPKDYFLLIRSYLGLGQHYLRRGEAERAIAALRQAAALSERAAAAPASPPEQAYYELSAGYARQGSYPLALLSAHKALAMQAQRRLSRLQGEITHLLYHARLQSADEASRRQALATLEHLQQRAREPLQAASVAFHLAHWHFHHEHQLTEARRYSEQALALARTFGDNLIQAEALFLLGQLAYEESQYEHGDQLCREALALLERLHLDRDQLAEYYSTYARLLEGRGEAREAFLYFRRAYEIAQRRTRP